MTDKNENKEALLLFLEDNSLGILNEMLLRPIPTEELQTWSLTLDEYKEVIQKAIENILNSVVQDVIISQVNFNNNERVLLMFLEGGSSLFCESLQMDKDGLPSELSIIRRDKDGNEKRQTYQRKEK